MQLNRYILMTVIKILSVILGAMLLFFVGLMIGYGVIGDGSPLHVFDRGLWHHILDFVNL